MAIDKVQLIERVGKMTARKLERVLAKADSKAPSARSAVGMSAEGDVVLGR